MRQFQLLKDDSRDVPTRAGKTIDVAARERTLASQSRVHVEGLMS
jgi:hypothetical protein